jgi:hypothetical protein
MLRTKCSEVTEMESLWEGRICLRYNTNEGKKEKKNKMDFYDLFNS